MCVRAAAALVLGLAAAGAGAAPAEDQVRLGDGLYARGMYDLALREYTAVITNAAAAITNRDAVLFRMAECNRLQGNKDVAAFFYQRVLTEHTNSAFRDRAAFRRAEHRLEAGQFAEAAADFRALAAQTLPPEIAASVLYHLGAAEAKLGRDAEAADAYRRLLREQGGASVTPYARVALGALLLRKPGQEAEVLEVCAPAAASPPAPKVAAEALFLMGDAAFRRKDYATAAGHFTNLLARFPADERAAEAALPAAWSCHHLGRQEEALRLAAAEIPRAPPEKLAAWLYLQANGLRQLGRAGEAQGVYQQLLSRFPNSPLAGDAVYESALASFQAGDHRAVLERLGGATNRHAPETLWMLAESARALTNREQAAAFYARLAAEYPQDERAPLAALQAARLDQDRGAAAEAAQRYRDLAARFPKSEAAPEALLAAGYCRAALRQHAEASKDWKTLADQFPTFGKRPEALFRLAQAQVELKQDDGARATLTNLLAAAVPPAFAADANYLMAVLQERAGAAEPAEAYYRKALAASPAPAVAEEIQYRRVSVLQKLGKSAEAAEALQSLVSTPAAPRVPLALLDWLARWQLQENHAAQADAAATALALHGTNDAWRQAGWYLAGRARQAAGQWAEARQAYEKAAALNAATREGLEAAFHLGEVAYAAKDYPASSTWYARAAELAAADEFLPVRARSYLGLGRAARAVQNWEEARRFFQSTCILFDLPDVTPEALWGSAEALGKLGRPADRDQTLAELKRRYPDSEWAKKPLPN